MPHADTDADLAKLLAIAREFTAAFDHADVDRVMQFYGDTYVDVNLRNPLQSHAQRRQYYAQLMQRGLRVAVQTDEVMVEGNVAFIRGRIEVRDPLAPTENASVRELRYVEIARKAANGSWQVIWGIDGPVQEWEPERAEIR
jgi:ketosteroid isomerase-like protein